MATIAVLSGYSRKKKKAVLNQMQSEIVVPPKENPASSH
jgi:hypothetical protein